MLNDLDLTYPVYLYSIAWCLVFYIFVVRGRTYGIGALILSAYMVSSFFSLYFLRGTSQFTILHVDTHKMTLPPFVFLFINILICIWPLLKYSNQLSLIKVGVRSNMKILELVLKLSAPFVIWGFVTLCLFVATVNTSTLADIYADTSEGIDVFSNVNWLGKKCIVLMAWLNYLWPIFFFCCLATNSNKKLYLIPLLGFISTLLISYACAARVGIFRSGIYFIIVYLIFRSSLEKELIRRINLILALSTGVIVFTLALITISRFGDSDEDIMSWISMYAGEGALRFSENAWGLNVTSNGDTCFSLVKDILGFDTFTDTLERREHYNMILKIPTRIFYTYIGDWYIDLGFIPTLILSFLISRVISSVLKKAIERKTLHLVEIFILSIISLVFTFGFTYYAIKTYSAQLELARNLLFIYMISFISKKYREKVLVR